MANTLPQNPIQQNARPPGKLCSHVQNFGDMKKYRQHPTIMTLIDEAKHSATTLSPEALDKLVEDAEKEEKRIKMQFEGAANQFDALTAGINGCGAVHRVLSSVDGVTVKLNTEAFEKLSEQQRQIEAFEVKVKELEGRNSSITSENSSLKDNIAAISDEKASLESQLKQSTQTAKDFARLLEDMARDFEEICGEDLIMTRDAINVYEYRAMSSKVVLSSSNVMKAERGLESANQAVGSAEAEALDDYKFLELALEDTRKLFREELTRLNTLKNEAQDQLKRQVTESKAKAQLIEALKKNWNDLVSLLPQESQDLIRKEEAVRRARTSAQYAAKQKIMTDSSAAEPAE